jgi:hypothetical protein
MSSGLSQEPGAFETDLRVPVERNRVFRPKDRFESSVIGAKVYASSRLPRVVLGEAAWSASETV